MSDFKNRAVVTGIGIITANASNRNDFLSAMKEGKTGIVNSEMFKKLGVRANMAGVIAERFPELKNLNDKEKIIWMTKKVIDEAMQDSGLDNQMIESLQIKAGLSFSSSVLGNEYLMKFLELKKDRAECEGKWLVNMYSSITDIAKYLGVNGPVFTTSSACASGTAGAGVGVEQIQNGNCEVMFLVGCDPLTEFSAAGFHSLQTMGTGSCKPFDKNRDGMIIGESAVAIIVESLEHAKKRNAHIYGEILGYGIGNDAYHITSPEPTGEGACHTMKLALERSGVDAKNIDYINVHGTATKLNDQMEINAISRLFDEEKAHSVMISSTKSMTGHCLGAAGSVELATVLLSVAYDLVPPTINIDEIDENFQSFHIVRNKGIETKVQYAMSNSFAFGGNSACIVVGKYE